MVVDAFGGGASRNSLEVDLHRILQGSRERDIEQEVGGVLAGACVRDLDVGVDDRGVVALDTNPLGVGTIRPGAARIPVAFQAVVADAPARRPPRILGVRGRVEDGQVGADTCTHPVDHHEIRRGGRESDPAGVGERLDIAGRQRGRVREGAQAGARRAAAVRMDADGERRRVVPSGYYPEFDTFSACSRRCCCPW